MALTPGTRLGNCEIVAPLGAGGMGEVYRARDLRLEREIALKVLPADVAEDRERLERFQREARTLASLDHPGIVTVFSVEDAEGIHFLTMQLVEGQALDRLIPERGLPVERIVALGVGIAEALAAAHDRGIVHRDLKPANIMVMTDGRVKVLDFGLAKIIATAPAATSDSEMSTLLATREGVVMGTVPHMSPEQVAGRNVDARTDIFSLGVILYEMASGRLPFQGHSSAELISSILRDTPPDLATLRSDLPDGLAVVIGRCLEKNPDARFQNVREVGDALSAPAAAHRSVPPSRGKGLPARAFAIAATAVILIAAVAYLVSRFGPGRAGERAGSMATTYRSITVLPLDNYSRDPDQDYFAEGITDELTADLARISRLRVISRGSAMQFKGEHRPSAPEIAKALDVDALVEGSVFRSGDRVRITAQLIDARADRHLWAKSFESSSGDLLTMQDELASAIAQEIHVQLTPAEQSRLGNPRSVDPEAYDAYLKGRYFFNRPSDENLQKAIQRFEEAIAISPDFVPALSGLSDAYLWAGYNEGFLTASAARPRAKAAAERAIELDDGSAEAHTSLAVFRLFYEYDWKGCEAEFRRAIELNPNYAFAHDQFALGLAFQGRLDESIAESRRAAELDPLSPQVPLDAVFAYSWKGDYEGAREQARRAAELDPTFFFPVMAYGWIDLQAGKVQEAIPYFEKAKAMESPAFVTAWLAYALAASGDRTRALAERDDLKRLSPSGSVTAFNLALVELGLGEKERAISYLEQAYASDSQWLGWLMNDRIFDPLRADPRFAALVRKMRFES